MKEIEESLLVPLRCIGRAAPSNVNNISPSISSLTRRLPGTMWYFNMAELMTKNNLIDVMNGGEGKVHVHTPTYYVKDVIYKAEEGTTFY